LTKESVDRRPNPEKPNPKKPQNPMLDAAVGGRSPIPFRLVHLEKGGVLKEGK
jgi:hypothetical protein